MENLIQSKTNQEALFTIQRSKVTNTLKVKIGRFEGKGYLGAFPGEWGLPNFDKLYKSQNLPFAFRDGFYAVNEFIVESISGLVALVRQKIDFQKTMSGPIGIAKMTGEVAVKFVKAEPDKLFRFLAFISAALGFFNLLPIPGLDGGHVLFNSVELVTRRRFPEKVRGYIEYAGLLFIILLTVFVVFNDIFNLWIGRQ